MNELSAWVETSDQWDIFDLRNVVRNLLHTELALIGFLTGYGYSAEIVRVTCDAPEIDVVYGVDIPSIANRERTVPFDVALQRLKQLCTGNSGVYFQRCMNDLLLAMQHPIDTAFFCYRAIEGLKGHAMELHPDPPKDTGKQWDCFREAAGCTREQIDLIKREADRLRHSSDLLSIEGNRAEFLTHTWNIVESYVSRLPATKSERKS